MHPATASTRRHGHSRSNRRLVGGIVVSVLLHGLLLSLQFGVRGGDAGGGGPISIVLAPTPLSATKDAALLTPTPTPTPTPALPVPVLPVPVLPSSAAPVAPVPPAPEPARAMRLVDLPPPPPAPPVAKIAPAPKTSLRRPAPAGPKRGLREVATPVIATAPDLESEFAVAVPLPEFEADPTPTVADAIDAPEELVASETPVEPEPVVDDEAERAAQEALALRAADDAREQALLQKLALQREQEQEKEQKQEREQKQEQEQARLAQAQRDAAEARRLAEQRQVQQQAERDHEALLRQREQQAAMARELAAQRVAQEAATQQAMVQAQLQARQRAEDDARRVAQEAAERQRIDQLAQRRLAEERARQQAAEQARLDAERLASGAAEEAARQAAAQRLQAQASGPTAGPAPGAGPTATRADGAGAGLGSGPGIGAGPGALTGLPGNRARELLRGVTIPNVDASGLPRGRPANDRRVLADGGERDAPLRLYVDSVRQKLERNAVLGGARLSQRDVRIDPLVSISLRSDGSIDEITIVRSSGRAEMDDAVRRFVRLNARYAAFPPNVAAQFDVIEIRRIWRLTDGLKLVEEMR
ncbi:energy transducer TonB [Massilia aurea]|uniref:energy transducer TonB n=1 Tax=Massilia aurea TaxID=373040 RepID=UPI0034630F6D